MAIYCNRADAIVTNCLIRKQGVGSGSPGISLLSSDSNIVNCTILENSTTDGYGGIYCSSSNPEVVNCIVRDNLPEEILGDTPSVSYCNVKGGFAGVGNIDADPVFISGPVHDYRLAPISPCIDAGNNDAVPHEVTTDIDGHPRYVDDPLTDDTGHGDPPLVDMGISEYQGGGSGLWVFPLQNLISHGSYGGPFTPDSIDLTLRNYDPTPIAFSLIKSAAWIDLSTDGGTIPPMSSVAVTVSIGEDANALPNGQYEETVEFINETTHEGDTSRSVSLKIGVPLPIIFIDLDDDPGWSVQGLWEFGQPAGQGGEYFGYPDPGSGYTGDNVYGYNLQGDYENSIGGPYYLTTTALDLSELTEVSLRFRRWLNCDYQPYVYSTLDLSTDGVDWTTVWENGAEAITEDAWSEQAYDVAALADNQPAVYLRWGHEVATAGAWQYSGWNIDDMEIWGVEPSPSCPADVNADNLVNIDDLFQLLAAWGVCDDCPEDINNDHTVDIDDVFAILGDWGPC